MNEYLVELTVKLHVAVKAESKDEAIFEAGKIVVKQFPRTTIETVKAVANKVE